MRAIGVDRTRTSHGGGEARMGRLVKGHIAGNAITHNQTVVHVGLQYADKITGERELTGADQVQD